LVVGELDAAGDESGVSTSDSRNATATRSADDDLAALFDAVGTGALEKMFPSSSNPAEKTWDRWAGRAKRNGLIAARIGRAKFNPYSAALWWFNQQNPRGWDWAHCKRVLAKNLPARSTNSKYLLTEELP